MEANEDSEEVGFPLPLTWPALQGGCSARKSPDHPGVLLLVLSSLVEGAGWLSIEPFPASLLSLPATFAGADYGQISEETWTYLSTLYGGGPEIAIRQNVAQVPECESLHGEQKIEAETRAA